MELSAWHMWWKRSGFRELQQLVMAEWDPIGVAGWPEAADEYDSYLGEIARLLREGRSPAEIAAHLAAFRENMGLDPDEAADLHASQRIAEWYPASTARFSAKPS